MKEQGSQFANLMDISASGARMELDYLVATRPHSFKVGDEIQVLIDGFDLIEARVMRATEDELGLMFLVDTEAEKRVLAEIMAALNAINLRLIQATGTL